MSELDALDPLPETLTLLDGTEVKLLDLRARQFFKLLRVITRGPALGALGDSSFLSGTPEEIVGRVVGLLLASIPDAGDEVLAFVQDMIQPAGLKPGDAAAKSNADKWAHLGTVMDNPELEDLVDVIHAIIKRESKDLAALGKKVGSFFQVAQKTGQLNTPQTSQDQNTSEVSPEPSTSSSTTTVDTLPSL